MHDTGIRKGKLEMTIEINSFNTYGYAIDSANLKDNLKLVLDNAAQKTAKTADAIIEQNLTSNNSALLFEYTQNIARSNVAQQLILDSNLKETLKFLSSEAAKKMSKSQKKTGSVVEQIFTDNDINDFKTDEQEKEEKDLDDLELFDIRLEGKKNIFAA